MKNMNPLDILKSRKLDYIPPHFSKMALTNYWNLDDNNLVSWIKNHSEGRYVVKDYPIFNEDGFKQTTFVAFEEEKELTFFMLAYPTTRR